MGFPTNGYPNDRYANEPLCNEILAEARRMSGLAIKVIGFPVKIGTLWQRDPLAELEATALLIGRGDMLDELYALGRRAVQDATVTIYANADRAIKHHNIWSETDIEPYRRDVANVESYGRDCTYAIQCMLVIALISDCITEDWDLYKTITGLAEPFEQWFGFRPYR